MTPKEEKEKQAVDLLRSGISWREAAKSTGLTEDRLMQIFTQWQEVQQAQNEARAKVG